MSKRKLNTLPLSVKLEIVNAFERGVPRKNISQEFGVPDSTLHTIIHDRKIIKSQCAEGLGYARRIRPAEFPDIEICLVEWMKQNVEKQMNITGPLIKGKAKEFAMELGIENFSASNGWLQNFKKRNNMVFRKKQLNEIEAARSEVAEEASNEAQDPDDDYEEITELVTLPRAPSNASDEEETRIVTNVSEFFDLEDGFAKCMVCDLQTENSIEDFHYHISSQHPELLPNKDLNSEIVFVKEEPKISRPPRLESFDISQSQFDTTEDELQEGQEDELTHFSRYLTSLLRTLPKKVQGKLQIDLLKTVMEAKMAADSDREGKRSLNPLEK